MTVTQKMIEDFVTEKATKPIIQGSYPILRLVRNKYVCYGIPEAIKVAKKRLEALEVLGVVHKDHL